MYKNEAGYVYFFAFYRSGDSVGQGVASIGGTISAEYKKDSGVAATLDVSGIEDLGDGFYRVPYTSTVATVVSSLHIFPQSSTPNVQVFTYQWEADAKERETPLTIPTSPSSAGVGFAPVFFNGSGVSDTLAIQGTKTIIRIVRQDAYDGVANPVKGFAVSKDFSGWTGTFTVRHRVTDEVLLSKAVTVISSVRLTCSLSSTDTAFASLTTREDFGPHPFDVEMTDGTSKQSAISGIAIIQRDQTRS